MSKSILVIDTPKSCSECECKGYRKGFNELCCILLVNKLHTTKLISLTGIRKDCPLQDTTELLEALEELKYATTLGKESFRKDKNYFYNKLHKALGGQDE